MGLVSVKVVFDNTDEFITAACNHSLVHLSYLLHGHPLSEELLLSYSDDTTDGPLPPHPNSTFNFLNRLLIQGRYGICFVEYEVLKLGCCRFSLKFANLLFTQPNLTRRHLFLDFDIAYSELAIARPREFFNQLRRLLEAR